MCVGFLLSYVCKCLFCNHLITKRMFVQGEVKVSVPHHVPEFQARFIRRLKTMIINSPLITIKIVFYLPSQLLHGLLNYRWACAEGYSHTPPWLGQLIYSPESRINSLPQLYHLELQMWDCMLNTSPSEKCLVPCTCTPTPLWVTRLSLAFLICSLCRVRHVFLMEECSNMWATPLQAEDTTQVNCSHLNMLIWPSSWEKALSVYQF